MADLVPVIGLKGTDYVPWESGSYSGIKSSNAMEKWRELANEEMRDERMAILGYSAAFAAAINCIIRPFSGSPHHIEEARTRDDFDRGLMP